MATFTGSSGFTINGGNFGNISGNINNVTYSGPGHLPPLPLSAFQAPARKKVQNTCPITSPPQVHTPSSTTSTPELSPSASNSSSPSSTTTSLASDNPGFTNSGASRYSTPPSSIASETRPPPVSAPSADQIHPGLPPTNALSPLSLDLQRLATPITPAPMYQSQTKSDQPWQTNVPDSRYPLGWDEYPAWGYPPHQPPPSPLRYNQRQSSEVLYDSNMTYQHSRRPLQVVNTTPIPNEATTYNYPPPPPPATRPSWPPAAEPQALPTPDDQWEDPSTKFQRLQSQRPTKGYPTALMPPPPHNPQNSSSDYGYPSQSYSPPDRAPYPPRGPTNDLGLYTTPSQPPFPSLTGRQSSYNQHSHPSSPSSFIQSPPPPLPPWTSTSIIDWSQDIEHRNPEHPRSNSLYTIHEQNHNNATAPYPPLNENPIQTPYNENGSAQSHSGHISPFLQQDPRAPFIGRNQNPGFMWREDCPMVDQPSGWQREPGWNL